MKILGVITLMINSCCFGQGVQFRLYLTKSCSTKEQLDTSYYLYGAEHYDTTFSPRQGTVYLPSPGKYKIQFFPGPVLENNVIDIMDTGLYTMRYTEPVVQLYETGAVDALPIYEKCGLAVNGYLEDLYKNGRLRMRGNFQMGNPKDSIVYFYETGGLKKRVVYFPKIVRIQEFDSLGNLVSLHLNENKSFMVYREYHRTRYFTNGKIASDESSVKHVFRRTEYYPSGQLKMKQTAKYRNEYDENGLLRVSYTWKYKKEDSGSTSDRDFTITYDRYDSNRRLVQKAVFESWGNRFPQPDFRISRSDWIISVKKYEASREMIVVENMDTKEYLKKYPEESDEINLDSK